jgi:hypothetical protein
VSGVKLGGRESDEMMYDTNNAPRRRMYINGYYSDEFQIKSGVAQGCPLSPLLFLVVAEALRISIDMETGFKPFHVPIRCCLIVGI